MVKKDNVTWKNLSENYKLETRKYGNGEIFYFPTDWTNGWIVEMDVNEGIRVASAWFTPNKKIAHKINTDKRCVWILCIDCGEIIISQQGKVKRVLEPITHRLVKDDKSFTFNFNEGEHYCFTSVLIYEDYLEKLLEGRENSPQIRVDDIKSWQDEHLNLPSIMLIMEQIRWGVRNSDMSMLGFEGMVIQLLASVARNFPNIPDRRKDRRKYVTWENEQKMFSVKNTIDRDILNVPSMGELAKIGEMSESKLREAFKNLYGIPIYSYIRRETMKKGMQLLSSDHLSIRDVAEKCGFKNPSKFTEAFKDIHGITPSEFRKSFNL